jgi:hypothetical protein
MFWSGEPDDRRGGTVLIDCDHCQMRGRACADCVVTVLLGPPHAAIDMDEEHRAAIDVLAGSGLVPPLRLVVAVDGGRDGAPSPQPDRATG